MWREISKEKPVEDGLYCVAEFDGKRLVSYSLNFCVVDGVLRLNGGWCDRINITHWMPYSELREMLEKNLP